MAAPHALHSTPRFNFNFASKINFASPLSLAGAVTLRCITLLETADLRPHGCWWMQGLT